MSGDGAEPGQSFEERLRSARQRQGLEARPAGQSRGLSSGWGDGLMAGVELASAELVACAIGYGLDRLFHTLPLFLVIFVLVGGAAGVMNAVRRFSSPGKSGD